MREAICTGETVDQAREAACKQLGVETYEAEFEILEMPTRKTFGLFGGNPAKVRVFVKDSAAETAADYLKKILAKMGLKNVEVDVREEENGALLNLSGDDIGFVIGHRGETLDALQYLAGLVANHVGETYYRITLDIGNYREKRRQTLESLGCKIAQKSLRTGRNAALEPMNPYERRIIHTAVQTVEGAKSWSEGEDLGRHVVIGPAQGERIPRRNGGSRERDRNSRKSSFRQNQGRESGTERPSRYQGANAYGKSAPQFEKPKVKENSPLYGRYERKK